MVSGSGGLAALGSVGYGFGNGLRLELEGDYRGNTYQIKVLGNRLGDANANQFGLFANALYDFDFGWPVFPYIGAGVGYQWTSVSGPHASGTIGAFGVTANYSANPLDSTAGAFAVQAILGAAYPTGLPGLSLTAEYRFLAIPEDTKFSGSLGGTISGIGSASASDSIKLGNQYNHSFLIGARYAFNAAPPPPPLAPAPIAAPAPAPSRTYLVFFDWDRADLTGRARQIIAEAAQASTRVQVTQIEVSGYADRTGTAQYNLALSRRRADNVAGELVRLGVPRNVISIQAFGDTHLLVPTAEGVREPQNRRVEIVLK